MHVQFVLGVAVDHDLDRLADFRVEPLVGGSDLATGDPHLDDEGGGSVRRGDRITGFGCVFGIGGCAPCHEESTEESQRAAVP
ncbi:hypothetical protein GCM10023318_22450 [Nocardia callitridis]|uniref:Uncharacterized protein n=1 Tax=Nocardia callitridis TaxID=648753 RepID=A0ABP9K4M6_9NOCA